ncbi:3-hydroxyacyl-[acyl-carrier-protein] dehydratase [Rubellimicrobium thermophilum DSM 16684]|uniref:3-hydroxyacyl-[acyl-carrier-protein] dehydratase FabZ n=1 Tax=Rubellimicrobium thermophilum DSM 16684 TaxID=1123069 RepID=S9QXN8_9RHOB|nr:3-hydroxyacyl-ACP dehydratase FabZ [Rubellimicrobium thermophilum]EPX86096.1 3-hydroxyacyl-[acyl-carrier-protein] dehydratase [Rubellimicrobium thermophilum DSM 16684]
MTQDATVQDNAAPDQGPVTEADIQLIQRILPHRYPFLLVDRVLRIDGIRSAQGIKNVTMNEPHFQGHFPGEPIMPGVTIIEAMAQTAAVMVGASLGLTGGNLLIYFMSIDNAKFRRKVVPGDRLVMDVTTLRGKPGARVWRFRGVASVEGELAAEAEFMAMLDMKAV